MKDQISYVKVYEHGRRRRSPYPCYLGLCLLKVCTKTCRFDIYVLRGEALIVSYLNDQGDHRPLSPVIHRRKFGDHDSMVLNTLLYSRVRSKAASRACP